MRRLFGSVGLAALLMAFVPTSAHAQQTFNMYLGGFDPHSYDARDPNDVLVQDIQFLNFDINGFAAFTFGGEYLVNVGDHVELGGSVGYYQNTKTAADCCYTFANGTPVYADLKLRIVPFSATARVLPFGQDAPVQPYIGAGLGIFGWRYSESGNFVASDAVTIIQGNYVGTGWDVGPVILGGVRVPVGRMAVGFEYRYQNAVGTLPIGQGFAGSKIDLGGSNYLATIAVKF